MKHKLITTCILAITGILSFCMSSFATVSMGYWHNTDSGRIYTINNFYHYSEGWHNVNGYDYYFKPDGSVYSNGLTPDGYTVNASGQWTVDGVPQFTSDLTAPAKQWKSELDTMISQAIANDNAAGAYGYGWKTDDDYYRFVYGNNGDSVKQRYAAAYDKLNQFFTGYDWIHADEMTRFQHCYDAIACGRNGNTYDISKLGSPVARSGWQILVEKNGVCRDFANDLTDLCRLSGLNAYYLVIPDYITDSPLGHAMTVVQVNGQWYVADPTNENSEIHPIASDAGFYVSGIGTIDLNSQNSINTINSSLTQIHITKSDLEKNCRILP